MRVPGAWARGFRPWLVAGAIMLCSAGSASAGTISNRELVELTDIDSLGLSPDGRFLVFRTVRADIVRNSYVLKWHSVDLSNGRARDIGGGGDPIYLDPGAVQAEIPVWIDGGRAVVVRALVDGAVGLWKADMRAERMVPLVIQDEDIEEYAASPDGQSLIYRVGPSREEIRRAEGHEYDSGILVDSSVDLTQNLFRGASINGRMSSQRLVGSWFLRSGLLGRAPRQQRRYDLRIRTDTAIGAPQPVRNFELAGTRPSSQARSARGDLAEAAWEGKTGRVSAILANGRKLECRDPLCASARVAALTWRAASTDLMITFMDRERRQSLYLWSTRFNRLRKITASGGLLSGGRRHHYPCAISASAALCVASEPASPPRVERIDLETGARHILFDPNAAMRTAYRPIVTYLRWDIGGGRDAAGVLMRSAEPAAGAAPLYVNYYSCEGFLRGGEGDEWPIPELLDAGFAVACINAVPSTGPQDAVQEYRTGLSTVRALIDKLTAQGIVDRSKVAMGGLSFGSEVAMWVARHSDLIAALSISSSQSDPASYWFNSIGKSDRPRMIRDVWGLGKPDETPERWKLVSAALNSERIRAPILLQLPEQEARRIPEFYARLTQSPTPAELYAYPDEGHLKLQPRHRLSVYERNLDWFRYWLQDHRDDDPAKAGQYRRWDRLRAAWRQNRTSPAP